MSRLTCLFFCLTLLSCQYFASTETRTENELRQKLLEIDWNEVDHFPLFNVEDEILSKEDQLAKFQDGLLQRLDKTLGEIIFQIEEDINDTVKVDFEVDEDGFINVLQMEENKAVDTLVPNLLEKIKGGLKDSTVIAAEKRGIPVKIRFQLPVIIDSNQ